jgi:transcriptional regulator with XRE-family HTH domain
MPQSLLAQRLRMARAYRGWSQTELAARSKIHNMQISKLERGKIKDTSTGTLRALCDALGMSADYLLGRTEDMRVSDVVEEPAREELTQATTKRQRPRKAAPVG